MKISTPLRKVFMVLLLLTAILFSIGLFCFKQGSSNGRLFIWKTSLGMIYERPVGYGYGLFERNFNLRQASLYNLGLMSEKEAGNANFISVAYNDLLEHGVEGGVIGGLFFGLFLILTMLKSYWNHDKEVFIMFLSLTVMSMTNYVTDAIPVWVLLMVVYAKIASNTGREHYVTHNHNSVAILILLLSIYLCCKELSFTKAQFELAQYDKSADDNSIPIATGRLDKMQNTIGTSEAFYKKRAVANMKSGNFSKALADLNAARRFTSSPDVYYLLHICYMKLGDVANGLESLETLSGILPHTLRPKLLLMRCHADGGYMTSALADARRILEMDIKAESKEAYAIKKQARDFLMKYDK